MILAYPSKEPGHPGTSRLRSAGGENPSVRPTRGATVVARQSAAKSRAIRRGSGLAWAMPRDGLRHAKAAGQIGRRHRRREAMTWNLGSMDRRVRLVIASTMYWMVALGLTRGLWAFAPMLIVTMM